MSEANTVSDMGSQSLMTVSFRYINNHTKPFIKAIYSMQHSRVIHFQPVLLNNLRIYNIIVIYLHLRGFSSSLALSQSVLSLKGSLNN